MWCFLTNVPHRVVLKGFCFILLERIDCTHICFETYSVTLFRVYKRCGLTGDSCNCYGRKCSVLLWWDHVLNSTGRRRLHSLLCFSFIKIWFKQTLCSLLRSKLYIPFQLCWDGRISFQQHFKGICTYLLKIFWNKHAVPTCLIRFGEHFTFNNKNNKNLTKQYLKCRSLDFCFLEFYDGKHIPI